MNETEIKNDGLYSQKVKAGKRTYFFDVKPTKSNLDYFIIITESRRKGEKIYEKHKLFLYKEDFRKFSNALTETINHIEEKLLPGIVKPAQDDNQTL